MRAAAGIVIRASASFAIVTPLQKRVMDAATDAANLASARNIGTFDLGANAGPV